MATSDRLFNHNAPFNRIFNALLIIGAGLLPLPIIYLLESWTALFILFAAWILVICVLFTLNWGKSDIWISYFIVSIYLGWWITGAFLTDPVTASRNLTLTWIGLRATAIAAGFPLLLYFCIKALSPAVTGRLAIGRLSDLDLAVLAIASLGPLSLIVGLLEGNRLILVLGDVYGFFLVPLVYFLAKNTIPERKLYKFWWVVLSLMVVVAAFRVIRYAIPYFMGEGTLVVGGSIMWMIPLVFFPLSYLYLSKNRFLSLLFYGLGFVVIVLTFSRELWFLAIFSVPFVLILAPMNRAMLALAKGALIVTAGLLIAINVPYFDSATQAAQNFVESRIASSLNPTQHFGPGSARLADLEGSLGAMQPVNYLVGMGAGAEYYHSFYQRTEHHIHFTPGSLFFRTGVVGLGVFIIFIFISFVKSFRLAVAKGLSPTYRVIAMTAFGYIVLATLDAFLTYGIVNDIFWGFLLGSLAVIHGSLKRKDSTCAESPA